jgi:chromosome segregation ATPase
MNDAAIEADLLLELQQLRMRVTSFHERSERVRQTLQSVAQIAADIGGEVVGLDGAIASIANGIAQAPVPGDTGGQRSNDVDPELNELTQAAALISETLEDASERITQTTTRLAALQTADEAWLDQRQAALDNLTEAADTAVAMVEEKHAELLETIGELTNAWQDTSQEVGTRIDNLAEDLNERFFEPLRDTRQNFIEKLTNLADRVVDDLVPASVAETAENAVADIKAELDVLAEQLGDALEGFVRDTLDSREAGEGARATLQPALDQLTAAIDPVMNELDRIRGLAGSVGIHV